MKKLSLLFLVILLNGCQGHEISCIKGIQYIQPTNSYSATYTVLLGQDGKPLKCTEN